MSFPSNVQRYFNSLKLYIANLKGTAEPYVTSRDTLTSVSISYSTIPLPRKTKWVRVYFSRKSINAYMKHITVWDLYEEQVLQDRPSSEALKLLMDYVIAWQQEKLFKSDTRTYAEKTVDNLHTRCSFHLSRIKQTWEWFSRENAAAPLSDYFDTKFKEPITEFPYLRAYNYFFRKRRIDPERIRAFLDVDIRALDSLLDMVGILESGWDKCGKGDAFDDFRESQQCLLHCVQTLADALECEIHFYEYMLRFNQAIINFKLFPMD